MDTKLMFKALKKLPGKWFMPIIAFIWVLGAGLKKMSIQTCIILTAIVVAVWLLYLLFKWLSSRKKGEEEKASAIAIGGLEERFTKAIESKKDARWYLILGPSGSGKTSMLRNSGLDFSYVDTLQDKPIAMGIEPTKNCDLFYTDEAVILDTSGRYVDFCNEAQIREEFLSIFSLIKKLRKQNSLAGLMVPVDVSRLLQDSQEVMEGKAKNIRYCIEEIVSELQLKIPVYIVFTKSDSIHGFSEFFGALSDDDRGQTWGSVLEISQAEKPEAAFTDGCKQLADVLMKNREMELGRAQRQNRSAVYRFPLEFETVYQKLTKFVATVFQSISKEKPVFRSFHFVSSLQGDSPKCSYVMQDVAKSVNQELPISKEASQESAEEQKGYFIGDLFRKVVFSDRDLYAPTKAAQRKSMITRLITCGVILVILLALVTILTVSYIRSKGMIRNTQASVASINQAGNTSPELDREELRKNILRLEKFAFFWRKPKRETADAARDFYLLNKYGSRTGAKVKLGREVKIPVKVVKYEDGRPVDIEESVKIRVGEEIIQTDKKSSAIYKTKIYDGKAEFVLTIDYTPIGYERLQPETCVIQPGATEAEEVRFIFSKLMRTITIHCKDQLGESLSKVPVSIVEKSGEGAKYDPETTNEQGVAQFGVEAPEKTVLLIYCGDSESNYEAEEPYEVTIESGENKYSVDLQIRRKIQVHVIAYAIAENGVRSEVPGVMVSLEGRKLGPTGNNGEWKGTSDIVPAEGKVEAELLDQGIVVADTKIDKTDSGYSIMLKYAPAGMPEPVKPEPEPKEEKPKPIPPPSLQFAADSQLKPAEIEVWAYVNEEKIDGLESIGEMSFESAGKKFRLIRLDPNINDEGRLELPKEVEGKGLLLYHPDYWPLEMDWERIKSQISMISIKQERSFNDFDQKAKDGAEYFYKLADQNYSDGKFAEAIKNYQNAIRLLPKPISYLGLGWAYFDAEQIEKAVKQSNMGLELKLLDDPADGDSIKELLNELLDTCKES